MALEATVTQMAQIMEQRGHRQRQEIDQAAHDQDWSDSATVPAVLPRPSITVLYVGPFVFDQVLERKAARWKEKLAETYAIEVEMCVAELPFQTDDLECKGYW